MFIFFSGSKTECIIVQVLQKKHCENQQRLSECLDGYLSSAIDTFDTINCHTQHTPPVNDVNNEVLAKPLY